MNLFDKYGYPIIAGDVVTYDIHDETLTLESIRPLNPYLANSHLTVAKNDDTYELRWYFGDNLNCVNAVNLDDASAKALRVIGHDDSLGG